MNRLDRGDFGDWRGRDDRDDTHHKCWGCDTWFDIDYDFTFVAKLDDWVCDNCAYQHQWDNDEYEEDE